MNYFSRKEELKIKAVEHTKYMAGKYFTSKGIVYGEFGEDLIDYPLTIDRGKLPQKTPDVQIINTDVVGAIVYASNLPDNTYNTRDKRHIWVLNFASYKNPGGMFIEGSSAQEESICHISNLYNHLITESTYYATNKRDLNRALYRNRAIIHRNVKFEIPTDSGTVLTSCNVITCAAPNFKAAHRFKGVSYEEGLNTLTNRTMFLYDVVTKQLDVDILILGAWGCGVFGNKVDDMANLFRNIFHLMPDYRGTNWNPLIIHPLPDKQSYDRFRFIYGK